MRAASSAGSLGLTIGTIFALTGLTLLIAGIVDYDGPAVLIIGTIMSTVGVVGIIRARGRAKHVAWLRANGLSLTARIMSAGKTGTSVNDVPEHQFTVQVAGPHGHYSATFRKLVPEHQAAALIGGEIRVRANPSKLEELIPED
jgi:hypothetical protein